MSPILCSLILFLWFLFFCLFFFYLHLSHFLGLGGKVISLSKKLAFIFPALLLVPFLSLAAFSFFKWKLIFPSSFHSSFLEGAFFLVIPAFVLFLSSGAAFFIYDHFSKDKHLLLSSQFYKASQAYSLPRFKVCHRFFFLKSFLNGLSQSLPWFFSELIIVEVLFNAKGLALLI